VNDLATAEGKLGVLLNVNDSTDTNFPKNRIQDLYVFSFSAPSPARDTTAPTVAISSPAANATVSGTSVSLTATASDDVGVANVQFQVDGTLVGSVTAAPYTVTWDSTTVGSGTHALQAIASDAAGNIASASESVTVGTGCARNAPTVSLSPNSMLATSPGQAVSYTVSVKNNDVSSCSTTNFALGVVVPPGWTAVYAVQGLDVPPGSTRSSGLSLTPPLSAGGVSGFTATASRASGTGPGGSISGSVMVASALDVGLTIIQSNIAVQLMVQVGSGSAPISGASVKLTVLDPGGKSTTLSATTNASGTASVKFQPKGRNSKGVYQVQVAVSGGGLTGTTSGSFINQ